MRGTLAAVIAVVIGLALTGCAGARSLFLGLSPSKSPGATATYQVRTASYGAGLGSARAHQVKSVHARDGRYSVGQVRHVFRDVGFICKRSPTFAGLVILGCRFPVTASRLGVSAYISNPNYKGAILYGLPPRTPGTVYTRHRNVTLSYRPTLRPFARIVLSLLR